jgi:hypothetical protein
MKEKIHLYFRKPFNCAQTIIKIIEDHYDIPSKNMEIFIKYGGGNAPEGTCGALYALRQYLPIQDYKQVRKSFKDHIGSEKCKDIRKAQKFSCQECIKKAIDLYEKFIQ